MTLDKKVLELAELVQHYINTHNDNDSSMTTDVENFQEFVDVAMAHMHLTSRRDIEYFGYFPTGKGVWEAYAARLMELDEWPSNIPLDKQAMDGMYGHKMHSCNDYYFLFNE